jgi:hypothetical protein
LLPRGLYEDKARLAELQQTLLRDDQTIKDRKNVDPQDLALKATVTASAEHEGAAAAHVINGLTRDMPTEHQNRWAAPMSPDGAWLELAWQEPQAIRHIQLTFDTGFHRELTLSASDSISSRIVRAPQPETVRDYTIFYRAPGENEPRELAQVTGNHQRLRRHDFEPVTAKAIRIQVRATNGDTLARVFEVRCYS